MSLIFGFFFCFLDAFPLQALFLFTLFCQLSLRGIESGLYFADDWRVNKKLTLNLGLRLNWHNWWTQQDRTGSAGFALQRYNPSQAPVLFQPTATPQGRRGVNPLTGEIVPA